MIARKTRYTATLLIIKALIRYKPSTSPATNPLHEEGSASYAATGFKGGWLFKSFCKTQYASQPGWDHFLKCHKQIISLLDFWRGLGAQLKVSDGGGYWESRSEKKLQKSVGCYDRLVAAAGGALEDAGNGMAVESPIFDYKNFGRLEYEGQREFGGKIRQFKRLTGLK